MNSGFETIGNAILIAYDHGETVLVTDPWLSDQSYFGSWTHSHAIPDQQRDAIKSARYIWISHGHPDHLDSASLKTLRDKKILLPDHVGKRIAHDLKEQGYDLAIMEDRRWYSLSDHVRVFCISNSNQDAILLVDINGRLIINQNDAPDLGWGSTVRKIAKRYDKSFLLALSGRYGDADMMNFFDEEGERIPPRENIMALGASNALSAEVLGAKAFIPFSSMHRYQRSDSIWANKYRTSLEDYQVGYESSWIQGLPAFISYDCTTDDYRQIDPEPTPFVTRKPEEFGDYWDQTLEAHDMNVASEYFQGIEHLSGFLDFINLRVGGKDNFIYIHKRPRYNRGITFEAPRNSLMKVINYRIFDDLLIGNFMKTSLHGQWGERSLYPDFSPYVAKYADNGLARTERELKAYIKAYRQRAILEYIKYRIEEKSEAIFRSLISEDTTLFRGVKHTYWIYKRSLSGSRSG